MTQKRATSNPSLFEAADSGTTDNTEPIAIPASQSKRTPSKQYIPVYRIELVRERTIIVEPRRAVHNSDDVVAILKDELLKADRERLICLMLNSKNVIIGMDVVSVGTLNQSCAHPRELFKAAILSNSAAIILVHPSGGSITQR